MLLSLPKSIRVKFSKYISNSAKIQKQSLMNFNSTGNTLGYFGFADAKTCPEPALSDAEP